MITKLILSDGQGFGERAVQLVPLLRSGAVSHDWLQKNASVKGTFDDEIANLKRNPKQSVIHVLAVGDYDRYGLNRNSDGFLRKDNQVCHERFKKEGHVFKDHEHKDPSLKTGDVLATAHNGPMSRIELLLGLDNDKYGKELAEVEKGGDLPVSMGTWQDHDVCTACGHKAKTVKDHCECIKKYAGEVTPEGVEVGMLNPDPHYFDISTVWRPADRIGYTLRKVAMTQQKVAGHELAQDAGLVAPGSTKQAAMIRLAEIEKRMDGVGRKLDGGPRRLSADARKSLKTACSKYGVDAVLARLHGHAHLLGAEDFCEVILGYEKTAAATRAILDRSSGAYQRVLDQPQLDSLDGNQLKIAVFDHELERELDLRCGLDRPAITRRTLEPSVPTVKVAHELDHAEAQGLADLYTHYRVALASRCSQDGRSDAVATLGALQFT